MNFKAICMLRGSPKPRPGAEPPLRVLVITPKVAALAREVPGLAQLVRLNKLKISKQVNGKQGMK